MRFLTSHTHISPCQFGHGLSFTTFGYSGLVASEESISFTVQNSGTVAGTEVVQLYLGFPASAGEPPQQLKGFEKVVLEAGAKTKVTLPLDSRSFSVWDVAASAWRIVGGEFKVMVGASSRDIRLHGTVAVSPGPATA